MKANKIVVKSLAVLSACVFAFTAAAAEEPAASAVSAESIANYVKDVASFSADMAKLSSAQQLSLLGEVNAAVAKLPASKERRAEKFISLAREALKVAKDKEAMMAKIFETVTPNGLAMVNEALAGDLKEAQKTDEKFSTAKMENYAESVVKKVAANVNGAENAAVRDGFAVITMLRAFGNPDGWADKLVTATGVGEKEAQLMREEWIPAALDDPSNYDSILGYAGDIESPNPLLVFSMSGPTQAETMMWLLESGLIFDDNIMLGDEGDISKLSFGEADRQISRIPRTLIYDRAWHPDHKRGEKYEPKPEPKPYPYTDLY